MRTEDILRFEAELKMIRQGLQASPIEAVFPPLEPRSSPRRKPGLSPLSPESGTRGAFVSSSQGRSEIGPPPN